MLLNHDMAQKTFLKDILRVDCHPCGFMAEHAFQGFALFSLTHLCFRLPWQHLCPLRFGVWGTLSVKESSQHPLVTSQPMPGHLRLAMLENSQLIALKQWFSTF